jgi:hypothetical protein
MNSGGDYRSRSQVRHRWSSFFSLFDLCHYSCLHTPNIFLFVVAVLDDTHSFLLLPDMHHVHTLYFPLSAMLAVPIHLMLI